MDKIDIFRYEIWSRINIKHVEHQYYRNYRTWRTHIIGIRPPSLTGGESTDPPTTGNEQHSSRQPFCSVAMCPPPRRPIHPPRVPRRDPAARESLGRPTGQTVGQTPETSLGLESWPTGQRGSHYILRLFIIIIINTH